MSKHAYLIIAHNEEKTLQCLIRSIDDERNDIFICIDKKSKSIVPDDIKKCVKKSNIFIYNNIDVRWGDSSQAICEMFLMKKANNLFKYRYYHILSGVDLLIKSQDYIHDFFRCNDGKEFIHFDEKIINKGEVLDRVKYYHILSKYYKVTSNKYINYIFVKFDKILVNIQKKLKKERIIVYDEIQKGCNWCSITNDLVEYIIDNEEKINQFIYKTKCVDELFIQTLVVNSRFRENLYNMEYDNNYNACLRLIIWNEYNKKRPQLLTIDDYEIIRNSKEIFARKVSYYNEKSKMLIDKVYNEIIRR